MATPIPERSQNTPDLGTSFVSAYNDLSDVSEALSPDHKVTPSRRDVVTAIVELRTANRYYHKYIRTTSTTPE